MAPLLHELSYRRPLSLVLLSVVLLLGAASASSHVHQHESGVDQQAVKDFEAVLERRPRQLRPNLRVFLIIKQGRTGSSYLTSLLNSNPRVMMKGEALNKYHKNGTSPRDCVLSLMDIYDDLTDRLDQKLQAAGADSARGSAVGTSIAVSWEIGRNRVLGDPTARAMLIKLLQHHDAQFVWWQRANTIKWSISRLYHRRNRECGWNLAFSGQHTNPDCWQHGKMNYTPLELLQELRISVKRDSESRTAITMLMDGEHASEPRMKTMYYEQFQARELESLNDLLVWLGVPTVKSGDTNATLVKLSSDDLRQTIENFDELDGFLSGTCLQQQLRNTDPAKLAVGECSAESAPLKKLTRRIAAQ